MNNTNLYPELQVTVDSLSQLDVPEDRKKVLQELIDYIVTRIETIGGVNLNFICTHNSRRSHLAMIWAQTAADINNITASCHSGGTQATAFFHRSVSALKQSGFQIEKTDGEDSENPIYLIKSSEDREALRCFSKTFEHEESPQDNFAAVMVCDNADTACPTVLNGTKISVKYVDPKASDSWDRPEEDKVAHYKERSDQIGSEMLYVFSQVRNTLSQK